MKGAYTGHKLSYCPSCKKETLHFLVEGDGVRAWFCRNYEDHENRTSWRHCAVVEQASQTDQVHYEDW
jgi:hypothetical protein